MSTLSRSGGQVLRVYSKLESFISGRNKVIDILRRSVLEQENIEVSSVGVLGRHHAYLDSPVIGETAMVVIDVRQTRTLLTPERRDSNVDHWDELDQLQSMTNPPGSILIVLYGDEKSQHLEEDQVLAKVWSNIWTFNDQTAFDLAQKGVCFSLCEEFNMKQQKAIRQYLKEVVLLPVPVGEINILVLGDNGTNKEIVYKCMDDHPLLRNSPVENIEAFTTKLYSPFSFKHGGGVNSPNKITIFTERRMLPIRVCNGATGNLKDTIERELSSHNLSGHGVGAISTPSRQMFAPSAVFDRLILVCHCDKCFHKIYEESKWITTYARAELDKLHVTLKGDVLPVVDDYYADLVHGETLANVTEVFDDRFAEEKSRRLSSLDSKSVLKIYTWHACSTATQMDGIPPPPTSCCQRIWPCINRNRKMKFLIAAVIFVILLIIIIILSTKNNSHGNDHINKTSTMVNSTYVELRDLFRKLK